MQSIKILQEFEKPIKEALTHYPNLHTENIHFIFSHKKLPYAARPHIWRLINPFLKRKYYIIISKDSGELREPTLLKNLSYQAQVGVLGHELAHILYYSQNSALQIIWDGIRYLFIPFRGRFKKLTDRIVIDQGLGEHLLQWCTEVYPTKQKDGKRADVYYKPFEIAEILKNKNS